MFDYLLKRRLSVWPRIHLGISLCDFVQYVQVVYCSHCFACFSQFLLGVVFLSSEKTVDFRSTESFYTKTTTSNQGDCLHIKRVERCVTFFLPHHAAVQVTFSARISTVLKLAERRNKRNVWSYGPKNHLVQEVISVFLKPIKCSLRILS